MHKVVTRKPQTRSAYLPNIFGQATLHVFDHAELRATSPADPERGVAMLYRCTETGEVRQWGFEHTDEELLRIGAR